MTDFLSRLVERATGEPIGLQRRRPALFEPPVLASGLASAEPEHAASEQVVPEIHEERVVSAPADRAGERPSATLAITSLPLRPSPASASRAAPEAERREDTSLDLRSPLPRHPAEVVPTERPRQPRRPPAQPEPDGEISVASPGARRQAVLPDPLGSVEPRRPPRPPVEPVGRSEAGPRPASAALMPSSVRPTIGEARLGSNGPRRVGIDEQGRPSARSAITPAFAPLPRHEIPRLRPAAAVGQQPTAPAPTIHVTIGRVEVRAVPAQPVPVARQPRPTGPRLTLDEYLKLRAGGGK